MKKQPVLMGFMALIAVLLALNLAAILMGGERPVRPAIVPTAGAGQVLRVEGPQYLTTNEKGNVLTIWELGRNVGGKYESVTVQAFDSTGAEVSE